jgi:streptogramin lyase
VARARLTRRAALASSGAGLASALLDRLDPKARVVTAQDATPAAATASVPATTPVEFVWETRGSPEMPLDQPNAVAVDPQGNVWVLNGRYSRFPIFAPDGKFLEAWGAPGGGEGQFDFVVTHRDSLGDAGFDVAGNLYVADTGNLRIQKFDPNRRFVRAWGELGRGDGQFLRPIALGLGPDGRAHVADDERMDVQVFDADGAYLFTIGGPGSDDGQFVDIGRVAVAPDGSIVVGDWGTNRLQRFAPDGTFLTAWGSEGTDKGQFQNPTGIAVDGQGHVYVSEYASDRVQQFRLSAPWAPAGTPSP